MRGLCGGRGYVARVAGQQRPREGYERTTTGRLQEIAVVCASLHRYLSWPWCASCRALSISPPATACALPTAFRFTRLGLPLYRRKMVATWTGLVKSKQQDTDPKFVLNFGANTGGGLVLALLVVLINDLTIAPKPLSGLWSCETEVVTTNLERFRDLKTGVLLAIVSGFDNRSSGTFERNWDWTEATGKTIYRDADIVHGAVVGHYERRLLFNRSRNGVQLHILVGAHNRTPSYVMNLRLQSSDTMSGKYVGTVAEYEDGTVNCIRASKAAGR